MHYYCVLVASIDHGRHFCCVPEHAVKALSYKLENVAEKAFIVLAGFLLVSPLSLSLKNTIK
jgi:hypothetical protein